MVRFNLVEAAERRRLAERETAILATPGVELLEGSGLRTRKERVRLVTRVRVHGWTVARAARAAGVQERTAYRWLADGT